VTAGTVFRRNIGLVAQGAGLSPLWATPVVLINVSFVGAGRSSVCFLFSAPQRLCAIFKNTRQASINLPGSHLYPFHKTSVLEKFIITRYEKRYLY